jgi:hypothetical protein
MCLRKIYLIYLAGLPPPPPPLPPIQLGEGGPLEGAVPETHVHYSYLWTFDLYTPVCNAFDVGKSITMASGRGSGPGNQDFVGPCEMALSL